MIQHHPLELNLSPEQAQQRQETLAKTLPLSPGPTEVQTIAAVDVAYEKDTDIAHAAAVVLDAQRLEVIEVASWSGPPGYDYIPGLFALREASCLVPALEQLTRKPDVLLVDGHGVAHPRGFGLACLLGLIFELPTIGCAKSVLCGRFEALQEAQGSYAPLIEAGQRIGYALRTQAGINPVYVSPGYRYDQDTARELVYRYAGQYRIPEALRQAHHHSITLRQAALDLRALDALQPIDQT